MPRPGLRPMRALPVLEPRRRELETCVFCPKLCRSACPVSNAEPRETVTPWGKMSFAWMAAHGDVALTESYAAPAWACTSCFGCSEACDHRNPVADVLLDARGALARRGLAPEGARRVAEGFSRHDTATRDAVRSVRHARVDRQAPEALLVGCGYVRSLARETRDAIDATAAVARDRVALVEGCCGLPLLLSGEADAFIRHAREFARSVDGRSRLTVVDPGCAHTLRVRYPAAGVVLKARPELLVERAAGALDLLEPIAPVEGPVRWHDPCQLGRGLGVFDGPRRVLARLLGRPVDELEDRRELAVCSGAGGLVPSTLPDVSRRMTDARLDAHSLAGGGRIVTACASSVRALRRRGAPRGIEVDDLVTWMARGFGLAAEGGRARVRPRSL